MIGPSVFAPRRLAAGWWREQKSASIPKMLNFGRLGLGSATCCHGVNLEPTIENDGRSIDGGAGNF